MNHSCDPNTVITSPFNDYRIKAIALRHIEKGEELCFSYIDETQPFHIRQKELKEKYLFACVCTKCKNRI
jgi:SET domain-containing protein